MIRRSKLSLALAATFVGSTGLIAAPGMAQNLQRVEVTGSNIKRVDTETASPIQVITRTEIERTGKSTISEILQGLSISNNGSVPTTFGNGFAAGGSGVSLRGLTVNSTLVLVNGRRMAPYGLADDGQRNFADLSSIPLDLVDRVEILKDGASAIYGSDAIAGVVNIILRKDFKGFAASGTLGTSRYGDTNNQRASLTKGFGDLAADNYNAFVNLEVSHQDALRMDQRTGKRSFIGVADTTPFGYDLNTGLVLIGGYKLSGTSVASSPTGWARQVAGPQSASGTGVYTQLSSNCVPNASGVPAPVNANPACLWNIYDFLNIAPKEDKINLFGRGTVNINADTQAYGEFGLFNSKVSTRSTPSSVSSTWVNPSNNAVISNALITMGPNHPDNPFAGKNARLRYTTADLGGRTGEYDTTVARALAGVKGTAAGWDYDSGFLYTESTTNIERNGYIRNSVLQSTLNGTNPLGYYRLGVNSGLNSAALRAALAPTLSNKTKTSVTSLDAKVSRELGKLPGGAIGLAIGAELRQEKLDSPPTPFTDVGDIVGLGYSSFKQSRNVFAAYSELVAPVTKQLELTAAVRNDRYSDWGNAFTPKVGAKWQVAQPLLLRASYAEGFRAPGAAESGNSSVSAYTSFLDPVRCPGGVPAPGAIASQDCGSASTSVFSVGNKGIQPEKSQSYNLGFVLEPTKSFNVAVDFWQVERKNEIIGADAQAVLNNPTGFAGASITRDPTNGLPGIANSGSVLAVSAPYLNGPTTKTNGIDVDLRFKSAAFDNGIRLSGGLNLSHIRTFQRTLPDGTVLDYAGTYGPTALSSSAGMPRTRATFDLTGQSGPWAVTGRMNYVSGIKVVESQQDQTCLAHDSTGNDFGNGSCSVPSFTTFDVYASYKINKALEIGGSIQNLFDKVASFDPQASYGSTHYNPSYSMAGVIGRYFRVTAKYKFD